MRNLIYADVFPKFMQVDVKCKLTSSPLFRNASPVAVCDLRYFTSSTPWFTCSNVFLSPRLNSILVLTGAPNCISATWVLPGPIFNLALRFWINSFILAKFDFRTLPDPSATKRISSFSSHFASANQNETIITNIVSTISAQYRKICRATELNFMCPRILQC